MATTQNEKGHSSDKSAIPTIRIRKRSISQATCSLRLQSCPTRCAKREQLHSRYVGAPSQVESDPYETVEHLKVLIGRVAALATLAAWLNRGEGTR
jgi:hypothetical protein